MIESKAQYTQKKERKKEKNIYIYRNKQGMMFGLMKDCSKYQYLFPDWGAQWQIYFLRQFHSDVCPDASLSMLFQLLILFQLQTTTALCISLDSIHNEIEFHSHHLSVQDIFLQEFMLILYPRQLFVWRFDFGYMFMYATFITVKLSGQRN